MLNPSRVLDYVKDNLGFPFMTIELTDQQIIDYFTTYTLRTFSQYFPDVNRINMNPLVETNQVSGRGNEYYVNDPEGLEILNVKNIYFDQSDLYAVGHPPIGPFSQCEIRNWALDVANAGMLKMVGGNYDRTFEFMHPNKVRISPVPNNIRAITIEYERIHRTDLGTIPNEFQTMFCDLAMSDLMIVLGRIRKKFGNGVLRTPFGEIPLQSDIFEEGKEMKRDLLEKMRVGSYTNVVFDVG